MSTPVVTEKWAGNFDCDFCRRKRLMGTEFSKKALEKYRKTGGKLKCKECVAKVEEEERKAAAAKRAAAEGDSSEPITCAACQKSLTFSAFNKNQWNKGAGKGRCRSCVEQAVANEATAQQQGRADKIAAAKEKVAKAEASGNPAMILKAESELAALEAEKVTGLKPIKMGRGRGGRGRGRGGRR